jgi:hypothetical protein
MHMGAIRKYIDRKLFDGWQAGLLVLVVAGTAIVFVMPHPAEPWFLPQPRIDAHALAAVMAADDLAAAEAKKQQLDVDVRKLGSAIRVYNEAAVAQDQDALLAARALVVKAAGTAVARSPEQTAALRAYQMTRFIEELRSWQRGAEQRSAPSAELGALGGDFVAVITRSHWCAADSRQLLASEAVLRAMFKKRYNDVTGIKGERFGLTVDEDRVRYAFLIEHPFASSASVTASEPHRRRAALRSQMRLIGRLRERDAAYPADIARGVVLYRASRFAESAGAFQRWLAAHPDGRYTLRVRNHLKAALDAARRAGY